MVVSNFGAFNLNYMRGARSRYKVVDSIKEEEDMKEVVDIK